MQMQPNPGYKWVYRIHEGLECTAVQLTRDPYCGVVVELGEVKIDNEGIEFPWRLLDTADSTEELTNENVEFTKYLHEIVRHRLAEGGIYEVEGEDSSGE